MGKATVCLAGFQCSFGNGLESMAGLKAVILKILDWLHYMKWSFLFCLNPFKIVVKSEYFGIYNFPIVCARQFKRIGNQSHLAFEYFSGLDIETMFSELTC